MSAEVRNEIKRILYMARKAIEHAERFGGETARGWAKSTLDTIQSDLQDRYPDEDFD